VILLTRLNLEWVMAGELVECDPIYPAEYVVSRAEPVELQFMNGTAINSLIQL
jgi:hypothetical protein